MLLGVQAGASGGDAVGTETTRADNLGHAGDLGCTGGEAEALPVQGSSPAACRDQRASKVAGTLREAQGPISPGKNPEDRSSHAIGGRRRDRPQGRTIAAREGLRPCGKGGAKRPPCHLATGGHFCRPGVQAVRVGADDRSSQGEWMNGKRHLSPTRSQDCLRQHRKSGHLPHAACGASAIRTGGARKQNERGR